MAKQCFKCRYNYNSLVDLPVEEIMSIIMKDVDENTFDIGISKGSFQFLYEQKEKLLIHKYFNGDALRYSIAMSEIMRPYDKDTLRLKEIHENNIKWLSDRIKLSKKWGGNPIKRKEMINDYNFFVDEFNEKSKPIRKLINKHLKMKKNGGSVSKL